MKSYLQHVETCEGNMFGGELSPEMMNRGRRIITMFGFLVYVRYEVLYCFSNSTVKLLCIKWERPSSRISILLFKIL